MICATQKNENNTWSITPQSGKFEGQVIANADGISLRNVISEGKTLYGEVKAVWGAVVTLEDVYGDIEALKTLCIGKSFSMTPNLAVWLDFDGLCFGSKSISGAKLMTLMGEHLYAKGIR